MLFNTLNEILKENIKLEELTLNNCNIGDEELKAFVDILKTNTDTKLLKLDLRNNRLTYNFYNNISDEGAIALANLLQTNRTIRWIDFCNNNIDNKGLKALADVVKTNSKVITLDLLDNNISSDEELKRLENALEKNVATQNSWNY